MKREINNIKGLENYQYYEVGVDDNPFNGGGGNNYFYVSTYKNESDLENNRSTEIEFNNQEDYLDFILGKEDITE
ncbi:hypothetical protein [Clostridium arbusti]|uniref:hypothetical protein n=1 Tax=Clostridium arbusti TaxID=1137848 RepID=UPI000287F46A|nr:hypothetical protein [Clostridium arbusti]